MKNKLLVTILLMVVLSSLFVVKTFATETGGEAGTGGAGTTEEWTDFSGAKYEIKMGYPSNVYLNIKNVTLKEKSYYYYKITTTNSETPEFNYEGIISSFDEINITKYYELDGDMYLWIKESNPKNKSGEKEKMVVSGQKLERLDYNPHYYNAFRSTVVSNSGFTIIMNYWCASGNTRSANIKIGKVNNQTLLKKIKNNEAGSWEELLQYAKTSDATFSRKLKTDSGSIMFRETEENSFGFKNSNVEDGAYYYLYVDVDSENEKYYPVGPAVTLARASVLGKHISMFFYGSNDFKWELPEELPTEEEPAKEQPKEEEKKDETIAKEKMPNTGLTYIVTLAIGTVTVLGAVAYKKHNNLRGI